MDQSDRVKENIRVLMFIVSLPFWALFTVQIYSLWLGDPYQFDVIHILVVAALYVFFRTTVLGKGPFGTARVSMQ